MVVSTAKLLFLRMDFLNSILDNIDQALIVTDPLGSILFFNKVAQAMNKEFYGRPIAEQENILAILNPRRQTLYQGILQELQINKLPYRSYDEIINRAGATIYLELNFVPIKDESDNLIQLQLFMRDYTAQKVFEKNLLAQAAYVGSLVEHANAIFISVDTRGYIVDWNEYCFNVSGFEKNEVYTRKFEEILLAEEEWPVFHLLMSRILNHELISNYEMPIRTKEGRVIIFLLSVTTRTNTTGEIIGITFVGQDITELTDYRRSLELKVEERTKELKRILKKEKEVVEMKSRFVSIASHEFRTPLSSIKFSADFIKKNNQRIDSNELNLKLENIEKQINHMTYLLDDILTYGKSEAGKIQLVVSNIVPTDFLQRIIEEVGISTKNTHIITTDFIDLPAEMQTDEKLLRSVLINLLTNAIKYSPGRNKIYLHASGVDGVLTIHVRDEGMGIAPDEIEKIFEPFLRGKSANSIQGTGLGLSITKKAVELLNGNIKAESRLNEETTFSVTIPLTAS